jgi:folate-dependent tRNA-U54 methylase TrmFO/GidA
MARAAVPASGNHVMVIGTGLSGLVAAWQIGDAGKRVS